MSEESGGKETKRGELQKGLLGDGWRGSRDHWQGNGVETFGNVDDSENCTLVIAERQVLDITVSGYGRLS